MSNPNTIEIKGLDTLITYTGTEWTVVQDTAGKSWKIQSQTFVGPAGPVGNVEPYIDTYSLAYMAPSVTKAITVVGGNFDSRTTAAAPTGMTIDSITIDSNTTITLSVTTLSGWTGGVIDILNGTSSSFGTSISIDELGTAVDIPGDTATWDNVDTVTTSAGSVSFAYDSNPSVTGIASFGATANDLDFTLEFILGDMRGAIYVANSDTAAALYTIVANYGATTFTAFGTTVSYVKNVDVIKMVKQSSSIIITKNGATVASTTGTVDTTPLTIYFNFAQDAAGPSTVSGISLTTQRIV